MPACACVRVSSVSGSVDILITSFLLLCMIAVSLPFSLTRSTPLPHFALQMWDLRREAVVYNLAGHNDTITGLSLSPNGCYLLSNSMDSTGGHWP